MTTQELTYTILLLLCITFMLLRPFVLKRRDTRPGRSTRSRKPSTYTPAISNSFRLPPKANPAVARMRGYEKQTVLVRLNNTNSRIPISSKQNKINRVQLH